MEVRIDQSQGNTAAFDLVLLDGYQHKEFPTNVQVENSQDQIALAIILGAPIDIDQLSPHPEGYHGEAYDWLKAQIGHTFPAPDGYFDAIPYGWWKRCDRCGDYHRLGYGGDCRENGEARTPVHGDLTIVCRNFKECDYCRGPVDQFCHDTPNGHGGFSVKYYECRKCGAHGDPTVGIMVPLRKDIYARTPEMTLKEPFRSLPVRDRFRNLLQATHHAHDGWVDNRGLHTGEPGPLDLLITELEVCLNLARQLKQETEEENP